MPPGRPPHRVDVDVPPLADLEGAKLIEICSDLLEAVDEDPTVEPAGTGV